ncbi:MAG: Fe-S cluster assembly protein SufB [Limnochordia bacterium]|jgi:Fe-S cluster assembly protein SufB
MAKRRLDLSYEYKYGFRDRENYAFKSEKGLSKEIVAQISEMKGEPAWMRDLRLRAFDIFMSKPMPTWGADLSGVDFQEIHYYVRASEKPGRTWEEVPADIKHTFDRLGIPEAERRFLAGVSAQYESEVVYQSIRDDLASQGVVFCDTDTALRDYPEIFREYFGTVVPASDNKFAALNSAVWSGGSFIWVPEGVHVEIPLQAYFRINTENMGQFERTLIICEPGSFVHYVEGCTAPQYSSSSLHSAVVEIIVKKGARCRYSTIQNWSKNVYNLVTKRAHAHEDATMEWVDGNTGSLVTMKYPAVYLLGRGAKADILSIAVATAKQHLDAGAKVVHAAPDTSSTVISKSISAAGGHNTYRGLVHIGANAKGSRTKVECDTLIFDEDSRADTIPRIQVHNDEVTMEHEATVSKISEEQLFYLQSRGLSESEAAMMIVMGFIEPFAKELPMEYAVELNRLIQLEMEGSVG